MLPTTQTFSSWDSALLTYHAWLPAEKPENALLLFHRGHEHGNRWQQTIDALQLPRTAIFAWDQRNHGLSPGPRGFCPDISNLAKDADFFARHIARTYNIPLQKTALLASSVGAVIAIAWVHDFAPPLCGMVLAAPALRVKLYVPLAIPSLRMLHKVRPQSAVKSYVKSKMLTHDPAESAAYDADPLIFRQISVRYLLDLHDTSTRLIKDAPAVATPTLLLTSGKDWVVKLAPQKKFFSRLAAPFKQHLHFPAFHHSLFHELHRQQLIDPT